MHSPLSLKRILTRRLVTLACVVVLGGGGLVLPLTATASATPKPSPAPTAPAHPHWPHGPRDFRGGFRGGFDGFALEGSVMTAAEKDLNLSGETLMQDLAGGKSLNTLAGSKAATVSADALTDYKGALAAAVKAGRLTAAQQTALENQAPKEIAAIMARTFHAPAPRPHGGFGPGPAMGHLLQAMQAVVTKDLGISQATLMADLRAGKTLDQIAGSKATTLQNDLLSTLKTQLDALVAAKKMTAAEEANILKQAPTEISHLMSTPLMRPGFGHPPGAPHPGASASPTAAV